VELVAIGRWLAVLVVLWVAGMPVAAALFPRFPDRGAAFALPLALLVVSVAGYWVGQVRLGPAGTTVAFVALGVAAVLAVRRGTTVRWRHARDPAAVFLAGFCLLLVLRASHPGITPTGGEQFMDFGLVNAVLRADRLPPEDPWFAGRAVRYYYGGYLTTAILWGVSGVARSVAYNLSVATFYATLLTAAYGLAGAIAARHGHSARLAGLCGAALVGLAGNLALPVRLLLGLVPDPVAGRYAGFAFRAIHAPFDVALARATDPNAFDFWRSRHVIESAATVFPFWTFLNGDLRPHMTGAPFLLLVVALLFAYASAVDRDRRRLLLLAVLPPSVGYLGLVNTWDLPTALGVVFLAVAFAPTAAADLLPAAIRDGFDGSGHGGGRSRAGDERVGPGHGGDRSGGDDEPHGSAHRGDRSGVAVPGWLRRELVRLVDAGVATAAVGCLAVAWAAPYLLAGTPTSDGVGLFPPRSGLGGLVLVHGTFLGIFAVFLGPRVASLVGRRPRTRGPAVVLAGLVLVGAGLAADFAALALCGPLVLAGWVLARRREDVGFEATLLVAGAGLVLIVELAYVRVWPPDAVRWNTTYKVSMQVWLLWGIGAAVGLVRVLPWLVAPLDRLRDRSVDGPSVTGLVRLGALAVVVVLLVGAGAFPAFGTGGYVNDYWERPIEDPTLDGTAYVGANHSGEAEAIAWLRDREGTPIVVTAPGEPVYHWRSAPSSLTGVPTVVGWRHVAGFRGLDAYWQRVRDVDAIYTGDASDRRRLLSAYDVEYVYVGPVERERYGNVSFAELPGVWVVHRSGRVTIYRVGDRDDRLDADRSRWRPPGPLAGAEPFAGAPATVR